MMEPYLLLLVSVMNVIVAALNLWAAIMNNQKEPSSSAAKKGSKSARD